MEETKKQNGFLTPLQLFVQALAREDMNLMREALLAFERNNDLFYAELPKNVKINSEVVKYEGMGKTIIFICHDSGFNSTSDARKYH
ncbi:hypothetical protein [Bacillus cereus]|uniref:hypothetical protein n=1 Tax=Bacillus cereus TaxID=1396 RepID=UPI001E3A3C9C|nr:hypothetical protein [Bacillus cereus]